jgi:hypothetical protein
LGDLRHRPIGAYKIPSAFRGRLQTCSGIERLTPAAMRLPAAL